MEKSQKKLSTKEKFAYSIGQIPNSLFIAFLGQIQAFYYAWMGLSVGYIILAQIIYAIWNIINDPVFGLLQDRTRTKKGRYLPWIKWFSPFLSLFFIVVFFVPNEWRYAYGGEDTQFLIFLWYLITLSLYDLCFTIVYLAHCALLPQITDDFEERTSIAVMMAILGAIGMVASQAFPLIFLTNPTEEKIFALKFLIIIFGIVSIIPWIILLKYVRERKELIPEIKESFWKNIKYVFKNPALRVYMIYDGVTLGINTIFMTSITFFIAWTLGVGNPYSIQNIEFIDLLGYFIFPIICVIIGIWLQLWLPKKRDLKTLLIWDFIFMIVGFLIAYFGALPSPSQSDIVYEVPPNLWLLSLGFGIALMGFFGNLIYLNPLNADVVDFDEFRTGNRRESVYSGINCLVSKAMYSVVLALFPAILAIYGLLPASPEDPTSSALVVEQGFRNAITGVAIGSFLFPAILAIIGLIVFLWYPLDKKKLAEIRAVLEKKHAEQRLLYNRNIIEKK